VIRPFAACAPPGGLCELLFGHGAGGDRSLGMWRGALGPPGVAAALRGGRFASAELPD
jgi:hypothetical protein